jgi:hypothetical protein
VTPRPLPTIPSCSATGRQNSMHQFSDTLTQFQLEAWMPSLGLNHEVGIYSQYHKTYFCSSAHRTVEVIRPPCGTEGTTTRFGLIATASPWYLPLHPVKYKTVLAQMKTTSPCEFLAKGKYRLITVVSSHTAAPKIYWLTMQGDKVYEGFFQRRIT